MLFSSLEFIFLFLPLVLAVYFLLPLRARNYWLLLSSLFFYAWGEPKFVLVMLLSIVFNYFAALGLLRCPENGSLRKTVLAVSVAVNLGILFVFKYLGFTSALVRSVFPASCSFIRAYDIALPIGISFFTFQAMSYVIDVYRGIPAQKNICELGLYISFFPQLIAGPIVRYTTVMEQLRQRRITTESFSHGVKRFLIGFCKKILLSNALSEVALRTFDYGVTSTASAWLGAVCYTLQIYYDFSGYSDMAIGLGRMFGFTFLENFDYPYISASVTEFWRRWHISLGSWFRDYVYFPLGGSRVSSKLRLVFNLAVVWFLTGVWHGANLTFFLWGMLHGAVVIIEKLAGIPKYLEKHCKLRPFYRVFVLLIVIFGWVLFRADSISSAKQFILTMLGVGALPLSDAGFVFLLREYAAVIAASVLFSVPVIPFLKKKIAALGKTAVKAFSVVRDVFLIVLFLVSISFLVMNAHNPFIYFNF